MFIEKGEANWYFIAIVCAFAVIIGGGLLYELGTIRLELSNLDGSIKKISKGALADKAGDKDVETMIYEKIEGWGPCPEPDVCVQKTRLYSTGRLVMEGKKAQEVVIGPEKIEGIENLMRTLDIMKSDCRGVQMVDYGAIYSITLDGQTRKIIFPACERQLGQIDKLIAIVVENAEAEIKKAGEEKGESGNGPSEDLPANPVKGAEERDSSR